MPGGLLREGAITAVLRGVTVLAIGAGSLRTERRRVRPVEAAWGLRDAGQDWLRTWADMASADGAVLRRQP
ncbi:Uncharacterised protein [Bordetella pertussis]|nr:Uncharacterised protein [Bordetella pertussis]